jgi:uncharacterized protein YndB with AHSA1/START domain
MATRSGSGGESEGAGATAEAAHTEATAEAGHREATADAERRGAGAGETADTVRSASAGETAGATADREIVISRVIGAPRELVFEAFTAVRHLSRWWGPDGFTTTTRSFEFRVGGNWDFVMHGPDGTDYQEWITWREIVAPDRIALLHGESPDDPNAFESVLTFEPAGDETRIVMRTVFPTKELRDEAAEKYHAVEGGEQTLSNLAAYVVEVAREGTVR